MKRVLMIALALMLLALPAVQALADTATVTGGWLRLRAMPSFDADTLASCPSGTIVTILSASGSWYYVQLSDGTRGYMYGAYLKLNGDSDTAYVTSSIGLPVRLRSGPGTGYSVIATYAVGTQATILTRGTSWHYVLINGQYGYMMAQFLSGGASSGYTAYVTSSNGLSVRLRSGPGTGYGVLGSYSVGTQVTVLEHGDTWDYIKVGSRDGYMMTRYLTTVKPTPATTISGVTLSSYAPTVGQTLSASVSPAGAAVTYQWTNDAGTILSNQASYTVPSSQLGRKLRLTVTGVGTYTGSATTAYTLAVTSGESPSYTVTGVTVSETSPEVGDTLYATVQPSGASVTYAWYRSNGVQLATTQYYTVQSGDAGYRLYCVAIGTGTTTGAAVSTYTNAVAYADSAEGLIDDLNNLFDN